MEQNLVRGDWVLPRVDGAKTKGKVIGPIQGPNADDPSFCVIWEGMSHIEVWPQSMLIKVGRRKRQRERERKRVAASQSFVAVEVAMGLDVFNGVLRGADIKQLVRSQAFSKLLNKFARMQTRINALAADRHEQVQRER